MFFSESLSLSRKAGRVDAGCASECLDFEAGVVGKTVVSVFFLDVSGLDEGIAGKGVGCLFDIVVAADLRHAEYFKRVAQYVSHFVELVGVVGGKYKLFHTVITVKHRRLLPGRVSAGYVFNLCRTLHRRRR